MTTAKDAFERILQTAQELSQAQLGASQKPDLDPLVRAELRGLRLDFAAMADRARAVGDA